MKITPRKTKSRVMSRRITSPEYRTDPETGKKILLLSYADVQSNQRHNPTTKELFVYAAGRNEEGELPDGLDRLSNHQFVIHLDGTDSKEARAIGLDVVPARVYRSGVVPVSQEGVNTVTVMWELDGAVCRVTSRPAGVQAPQLIAMIAELDKIIEDGKEISTGTKLGNVGTVVSTGHNTAEVRLKAAVRRVPGQPPLDVEDLVDQAD